MSNDLANNFATSQLKLNYNHISVFQNLEHDFIKIIL